MVAEVLRVRFARRSCPPKHTATSSSATCGGEKPAVAHVTASIRFWRASERGMSSGSCEPVRMMGLRKPASISDSALAVYAIVSVPCTTMNASKCGRCVSSSLAIAIHSAGPIWHESLFISTFTSRLANVRSSGTTVTRLSSSLPGCSVFV